MALPEDELCPRGRNSVVLLPKPLSLVLHPSSRKAHPRPKRVGRRAGGNRAERRAGEGPAGVKRTHDSAKIFLKPFG